jgi:hypothetical protein
MNFLSNPRESLMKLDDLRKKGVITDDEFAVQKRRLLEK